MKLFGDAYGYSAKTIRLGGWNNSTATAEEVWNMEGKKKKSFWEIAFREAYGNRELSGDAACRRAILAAAEDSNEEAVLEGIEAFLAFRGLEYRINTLKVLMEAAQKFPELEYAAYAEAEKKGHIPFDKARKIIFKEIAQSFADFACSDQTNNADACFTFFVEMHKANYLTIMAKSVCRQLENALKDAIKVVPYKKLERWLISCATPLPLERVLGVEWTRNGGFEEISRILREKKERGGHPIIIPASDKSISFD